MCIIDRFSFIEVDISVITDITLTIDLIELFGMAAITIVIGQSDLPYEIVHLRIKLINFILH